MSWRIFVEAAATSDVDEQAERIGRDSPEAARRFFAATEDAYRRIARAPEAGRIRRFRSRRLAGLRAWLVPGFERHLVFYRLVGDEIRIVRVLHGARDLPNVL